MRSIFISYRRSDSEGEAGRLSDLLTHRFSDQSVFMDVDAIQPGRDFRKAIEESIQACSVLLCIIGPQWLSSADDSGERRLDTANDFVRLEIGAALRRDIPVIPILVRGAKMPRAEQLPPDVQDLAYRNCVELTHARWKSDLQILIGALEPLLNHPDAATEHSAADMPLPPAGTAGPRATTKASTPVAAPSHSSAQPRQHPPSYHPGADRPMHPLRPLEDPGPPRYNGMTPRFNGVERTRHAHPVIIRPIPEIVPLAEPHDPVSHSADTNLVAVLPVSTPIQSAAIEDVSKQLAHFIGPIAEIVVKRAAKRYTSMSDLCAAVSQEIESSKDRARFLELCRH